MNSVSNALHGAGDKASDGATKAAEGTSKVGPNDSYVEAARKTASDTISSVQNYFSGSSAGSGASK